MAYSTTNMLRAAVEDITVDSIDLGGNKEKFTFTVENTVEDFEIENSFSPVLQYFTARKVTSTITGAETTLAIMGLSFGLTSGAVSGSTLTINQSDRGLVAFIVNGKAGSAPGTSKKRTFTMPQTRVSGAVAIDVSKLSNTLLPLNFAHNADSSGVVGTITEHT